MSSYLDIDGVYDKSKRYIVNNWSNEDFTQKFGAESTYNGDKLIETVPARQITIKAGEMIELGQFEALLTTKHFVDREMTKDSYLKEKKERESIEVALGNKEARKPYEDKTISEIKAGVESPIMEQIRSKIREEERAKLEKPEVKGKTKEFETAKL